MKRFLFFFLILILSFSVFAESSATLEGTETSDSASVPVTLDLTDSDDSGFGKVVIGFSSNAVSNYDDIRTNLGSYSLKLNNSTGQATNNDDGELHVFYQIQSAQQLNVTLYAESPLKNNSNEIYFDVTGTEDGVDGQERKTFVNGITEKAAKEETPEGFGTAKSGAFVIQHNPSIRVGNVGSYNLTILTEDYRSKPMGTYTTNLIVKVEVESGSSSEN